MYKPTTLSFITTYRCPAMCSHCCFSCSPHRDEQLQEDDLLDYIGQANEIPSIKVVVFTGGECFLLESSLVNAVAAAHQAGYSTRCVTNGYWAVSEAFTKKRLVELKKAGLNELNFSVGDHHAEYIPVQHAMRGIQLSCELGLVTVATIEVFEDSSCKSIINSFLRKLQRRYDNLIVTHGVWIPHGKNERVVHSDEIKKLRKKEKNGCQSILASISINPSHNVVACCGLYLNHIPDLILGNLKEQRLKTILDQRLDFLKLMLSVDGPEKILDNARNYNPKIKIRDTYVHSCQSCLLLFKRVEYRDAVLKVAYDNFSRIYNRCLISEGLNKCLHQPCCAEDEDGVSEFKI